MDVNEHLSLETPKSFRFGTGQVLTLTDDQINRIPYLAAIASSADFFEAARDDQGCFRLHPNIDFKQFCVILDVLPFHFIRQIFTRLPKHVDLVSTIAHMDYLGLLHVPDPTLNDVDNCLFITKFYDPVNNKYVERLRPLQMCDMAVRFAIALIREAYDITDDTVHERIYWYVMFILSAHQIFESNTRHHVYKAAKHHFSVFQPSLLKLLKRLQQAQKANAQKNKQYVGAGEEEECWNLDSLIDSYLSHTASDISRWQFDFHYSINVYNSSSGNNVFPSESRTVQEILMEPLHKALVEIIYNHMQNRIYQSAHDDVRAFTVFSLPLFNDCPGLTGDLGLRICGTSPCSNVLRHRNPWLPGQFAKQTMEKRMISKLFENELGKEEIQNLIQTGFSLLRKKLARQYKQLLEELQSFQQSLPTNDDDYLFSFGLSYVFARQQIKEILASEYEMILEKLKQPSNIMSETCEYLRKKLCRAAENQIIGWYSDRQYDKVVLILMAPPHKSKDIEVQRLTLKQMQQEHRQIIFKPTPTKLPKFSRCRFN